MSKYVMALDQGTTSSRTIIFDEQGAVLASKSVPFQCYYPKSGWVEQNPEELWKTQRQTMESVLRQAKIGINDLAGIGITNQRETIIAWNKETGVPVYNAIVWQCRRTAEYCDQLKAEGFDQVIKRKTGLVTDAYFSGTKMRWILKEVPEAQKLAKAGQLLFGTVDCWLIWKLTGGALHATDVTNASRTLLFNIETLDWDDELLQKLEIPRTTLPKVVPSSGVIGETRPSILGKPIPIAGIAGDQQASLFGQACFEPGMAKNTYGTGCFMLMNTGKKLLFSEHGLVTTVAWQIKQETTYALEGSVFIGGALMQWLRDGLQLFQNVMETEAMANEVSSSGGVYIVPAFVGLGAPYWDPYARGTIVGLTRDTHKNHIVRAGLEAIAFQSADLLNSMESDTNIQIQSLRVDGGATANNFLCQFQADLLGTEVSRPDVIETTAMGAAFLAGLATGVWENQEAIQAMWKENRRFTPGRAKEEMAALKKGWKRAVERSQGWMNDAS
ncbi:glycerol kinase GlpK [Deltaproteobacteria bacterium TL4]